MCAYQVMRDYSYTMILFRASVLLLLVTVGCWGKTLRLEPDFDEWAQKHGKTYTSTKEYLKRRDMFQLSVKRVEGHNSQDHPYTLALNKFADLSDDEFKKLYLFSTPQNCSATHRQKVNLPNGFLPASVDWRKKGVVSPVKNQGACGSCWTFSTTGAMEAHMAIQNGGKYNLSEQQLVDCAQAFNNHGCSGGLPSQAFEYIHYQPGLMREEDYPYTAKDGKCRFQANKAVAFVKSVVNITEYDEKSLQVAVAKYGPVSIAFDVASDFRLYKKGVYNSKVCYTAPDHVNHAVLVVGYDTTPTGEPYWIVKNSWGAAFGIDGYFWIHRGSNMCGLADCASFPMTANKPTASGSVH